MLIPHYEKQLLNERMEAVSSLVDAALSILQRNEKMVEQGLMQKAENPEISPAAQNIVTRHMAFQAGMDDYLAKPVNKRGTGRNS